ncbi:switch-associated protein 70b isoform X2 [Gadus morhua]|uniref:switch-associated protein 70b isoform X2 n=1 Tax=Gadus morhua TaxID=8049 RepID=UPI0011B4AD45|nr:switch-associated protein 70-like isoform X2 [Gadus morhua]
MVVHIFHTCILFGFLMRCDTESRGSGWAQPPRGVAEPRRLSACGNTGSAMALRAELLKSIWHAFTALDVDKSGKVSKSQLKVLSYNLCTLMKIPHDPVALEEHFKDDDEGPVSNQGYMPYLNTFILDKVKEEFDRQDFDRMCWTLCARKNLDRSNLLISDDDAFKIWCIFNFLCEDRYPLSIVSEEPLPDKEGKKCLLFIKCAGKSYEISASDKKRKQEWIQAIQTCVSLLRLGLPAPHREARLRRREQRGRLQAEQEDLEARMKELTAANDTKQQELEAMRKALEEAAARAAEEERRRLQTQTELQDRYRTDLEREKTVRQQMEEQVALKSSELEQYLQRVRELEDMYHRLEDALEEERAARQDEETVRRLQARLLEEESTKREELEKIHLRQQRAISETEAEKKELEKERRAKDSALQDAMQQLEHLESERQGALEQYQAVTKKLEDAANNTRTWKHKVAEHEGLVRLIQPGNKGPQRITNWGPAAFSEVELSVREKEWQDRKRPAQ